MTRQGVLHVLTGCLVAMVIRGEQTYHREADPEENRPYYAEHAHGQRDLTYAYGRRDPTPGQRARYQGFRFAPTYRQAPKTGYANILSNPYGGYYLSSPGFHFGRPRFEGQGYGGHGTRSRSYQPPNYSIHDKSYHISPKHNPVPQHTKKVKSYDPCYDKQEGDYNLDGVFVDYFPEVNPQCNFVKCANQIAYSNPCSIGTKNDDYGAGFCSVLDPHFLCGHPSSKKKNKKRDKKPSH